MKQIKVEGLLDDLFSVLSEEPKMPSNSGTKYMDNLLDPHTLEDLYNGVILRLRTADSNATVKELMNKFFPENPRKSTMPKTISKKLIDVYRDQMENAIVEFCTKDALDIIDRTKQAYEQQEKDPEEISGDQYFGTILQQAHEDEYDLKDKLLDLYKKFEDESKKDEWQVEPSDNDTDDDDKDKTAGEVKINSTKAVNNVIKAIKRVDNSISEDDIKNFLTNEDTLMLVGSAIAKAMKGKI